MSYDSHNGQAGPVILIPLSIIYVRLGAANHVMILICLTRNWANLLAGKLSTNQIGIGTKWQLEALDAYFSQRRETHERKDYHQGFTSDVTPNN